MAARLKVFRAHIDDERVSSFRSVIVVYSVIAVIGWALTGWLGYGSLWITVFPVILTMFLYSISRFFSLIGQSPPELSDDLEHRLHLQCHLSFHLHTVNVGRTFSKFPGGRFRVDGDFSGQEFREDVILPYLEAERDEPILIDFSNVFCVSYSFIDEAFGPLMTQFGEETFDRKFLIVSKDDPDILSAFQTIRESRFRNN